MKKVRINDSEFETRYSNWIMTIINMMKPTNLAFIGGRGTAKSTDIIAQRAIDVVYDMPRAPLGFVSDTYVNLLTNIVPSILLGWERKKFFEDKHYVVDKKPPLTWGQPLIKTLNYKHTISTFNGCKFFLISLDRPSISAGISVVHHFLDEAKFARPDKVNKLSPTLRGDSRMFGESHFYLGRTFCTDQPDPSASEFDWILKYAENMDKVQIIKILQTAIVVNELTIEYLNLKSDNKDTTNILRNIDRWAARLKKIRQNSTFFYEVSSFANVDILTLKYFIGILNDLGIEEFKKSICSFRPTLSKNTMFYSNLTDKHFYEDGYNYNFYDKFGIKDAVHSSLGLKHLRHNEPLEAGLDAGNMLSLVIGQLQGNIYRVLKNFYTIPPDWIDTLTDNFKSFFKNHKRKILYVYADRSTNQYKKVGQDFISQFQYLIEHDTKPDGTVYRNDWLVVIKSKNQGNIFHEDEYNLMFDLMGERNVDLPVLLIDKYECKELKSSLEKAPLDRDIKSKRIIKVKKSEKLPAHRLPLESTNLSDAFKYLLCRKNWLNITRRRSSIILSSPTMH